MKDATEMYFKNNSKNFKGKEWFIDYYDNFNFVTTIRDSIAMIYNLWDKTNQE